MTDKLKNFRTIFLFILLLLCTRVFGQTGFSLGVGGETNVITLDDKGFAIGGFFTADYRFNAALAAGINAGAFYDRNQLLSLENRIFARWIFWRPGILELFLQGEAGLLLTLRNTDMINTRGAPSAGLSFGTRVLLPNRWYLEPYVRSGYPFLGGVGLTVGFSPKPNTSASMDNADLKTGEELVVLRQVGSIPEIASLALDPSVYFASNVAGFAGLSEKTIEDNYRLLQELAGFLKSNPEYNMIIEGHANPVDNTKNEEEKSLNPLSIERAEEVANILLVYGVDRKRLIVAGSGGAKTLVPWKDRDNWNLNRRVEFILIRQPDRFIKNEKND